MIGEKILNYLSEHGISQSFVADKIGMPVSQFNKMLHVNQRIDCVIYYKICKALDVPLETFLFDGESEI